MASAFLRSMPLMTSNLRNQMSWIGQSLQRTMKMKQIPKNINWDATAFFERLASSNKLAKTEGFHFCRVSGLEGFEEALHNL